MAADPHAGAEEEEAQLRASVVRACVRLVELGVNQGTAGNVSVRCGAGFLLTPSGKPYETLGPGDLASMDFAGRYRGPHPPTSEWRLHRAVLAARQDAAAVVHTHAVYSTAIACVGEAIPAFHYYVAFGGGATIRCAPYATYGTQELADNVVAALTDRNACLLANHGLLVIGPTLEAAVRRTHDIETLAQQYVLARSLGAPVILPDDEIERVERKLRTYGSGVCDDPGLVRLDEPESRG
jgi:L-fuculose-phosphate aldolase